MNNGGEIVDTQIPESQAISATPGNLPKQPGEKNGENNVNNRDSYTSQEKVRSPVRQASFSGRWDSAQTAGVPNETKDSRENQGWSRSKTRKARHQAIFLNQKHLPVPAHQIQKERNVRNQRKRKIRRKKQRNQKNKKKHKKSNHTRFEVIPGKSKNAWDLPESIIDYVIEHFEK